MKAANKTLKNLVAKSKSGKGTITYTPLDKEDRAERTRGKSPSRTEEMREHKGKR